MSFVKWMIILLNQNNLTKSTMKLFFDENEFKNLLTNLKIEKTVSGGSVQIL